jgi:hypothetical protein
MLAARARDDPQGLFGPINALRQRAGHHHEVVDLCFHGLNIPPADAPALGKTMGGAGAVDESL